MMTPFYRALNHHLSGGLGASIRVTPVKSTPAKVLMEIQMERFKWIPLMLKNRMFIKFDNIYRTKNSIFYVCGIFILCCVEFYAYGIWF